MKAIFTRVTNGVARATDNDGNTFRVSSYDMQFDEAHRQAAIGLCRKMGWTGKLCGGFVLKSGQNAGMVWVWCDDRYLITV